MNSLIQTWPEHDVDRLVTMIPQRWNQETREWVEDNTDWDSYELEVGR